MMAHKAPHRVLEARWAARRLNGYCGNETRVADRRANLIFLAFVALSLVVFGAQIVRAYF